MPFSVQQQYDGASVLITGALGFLGSVILERLLRLTKVNTVYLFARSKHNIPPAERVQKLLCSSLFHTLHQQASRGGPNVFCKVHTVAGDLCLPGLGLSEADAAALRQSVDVVVHCAASVQLDVHIQTTLRVNYLGTRHVLAMAASMPKLRSFVHVSTYFVNNHRPRNSLVKEQIYDLHLLLPATTANCQGSSNLDLLSSSMNGGSSTDANGGFLHQARSHLGLKSSESASEVCRSSKQRLSHAEFVSALLAMSPEQASAAAASVMACNGLSNCSYALVKHLTEQMVAATCLRAGGGVHKAIVRPGLISSVAGDPYPGYISGYAGPGGYIMGYALGFFQGSASVAYGADHILDLIPCDAVASLVITAAAAASAAAAAGDTAAGRPTAASADAAGCLAAPADSAASARTTAALAPGSTAVSLQDSGSTTIYHAASSGSYPLSILTAYVLMHDYFRHNPAPLRLPFTRLVRLKPSHSPTAASIQRGRQTAQRKVELLAGLLRLAGQSCTARQLENGFKAFCVQNQPEYSRSFVCSVDNVRVLRAAIAPEEQHTWQHIVWEPYTPSGQAMFTWDQYAGVFLPGVHHLLFRTTGLDRVYPSTFRLLPAASPDVLKAGVTSQPGVEQLRADPETTVPL